MSHYNLGRKCAICFIKILNKNITGYCNHHRDRSGANNPFFGKKHTELVIAQMKISTSEASKKLWQDPIYRDRVIKAVSKPRRSGFGAEQSIRIKKWFDANPIQKDLRSGHMVKSWKMGKIIPNKSVSCNRSKLELEFFGRLREEFLDIEQITIKSEDR